VKRALWAGSAGALVLGGGVVACAQLSDLATYSDCSGLCDASATQGDDGSSGATMDATQSSQGGDQQAPQEAEPVGDDANEPEDANESPDVATTTTLDSGGVVEAAAPVESGTPAEAGEPHESGTTTTSDAGDGGCASTDTVHNCSGCGLACNTSTGTPMCNGITCSYVCDTNTIDCNFATAPDTDGCECAGTGCCGAGCETAHESGIPSPATYYNCSPTGNTTLINATAVCLGVGGSACTAQTQTCPLFTGTTTNAVCGTVSNTCYCWVYSGTNSGTVSSVAFGPCNIPCQSGNTWN
jgi:hypothetical protein